MTGDEARKRLQEIEEGDEAQRETQLDALGDQIDRESRDAFRALARVWAQNRPEAAKARGVLSETEQLAVTAWLTASDDAPHPRDFEALGFAGDGCIALGDRLVQELKKLLENKTRVPIPKPKRPVEERIPQRRVCDEAYLLLRRALTFDVSVLVRELTEREFLDLEETERDKEIERYKRTGEWTALVEDPEAAGP